MQIRTRLAADSAASRVRKEDEDWMIMVLWMRHDDAKLNKLLQLQATRLNRNKSR